MKTLLIATMIAASPMIFAKEPATTGYRIVDMDGGSVYEKLGLQKNDLIKKINGTPVTTPAEAQSLFDKFKNSDKVVLVIERDGKEQILHYKVKH